MRILRGLVLSVLLSLTSSGRLSSRFLAKSNRTSRLTTFSRRLRAACSGFGFLRNGAGGVVGTDEIDIEIERVDITESEKEITACMGYLCLRGGDFASVPGNDSSDSDGSKKPDAHVYGDKDETNDDDMALSKNESLAKNNVSHPTSNTSRQGVHAVFGAKVRRGKRRIRERWNMTRSRTAAFGKQTIQQWSSWTNSSRATSQDRRQFLDRIALIGAALIKSEHDAVLSKETDHDDDFMGHDDEITHQSDLTLPGRKFFIVTTAALPWFTGTAVNPLLRAAYLCRKAWEINSGNSTNITIGDGSASRHNGGENVCKKQWVTLVVPWLELEEDRLELYGPDNVFANQEEQEHFIRTWMREEADLTEEADPQTGLRIIFYPARYHEGMKSIFAMGDICSLIPDGDADVCILEEPEHLNWYRAPGDGWTKKFKYVVGIVHTNYKEYASTQYHGLWTAPALGIMSSAMIRAYCHKVIKLSDVLQTFAPEKEKTSNVHGVRSEFLREGMRRAAEEAGVEDALARGNETKAYFIGKIIWAKGLDKMLEMQTFYKQCTGRYFDIDIYGNGPDMEEIKRAFYGRKHHSTRKRKVQENQFDDDSLSGRGDKEAGDDVDEDPFLKTYVSDVADDRAHSPADLEEAIELQIQQGLALTRTKLSKLSRTIRSAKESLEFDLPKTHYELRRTPIPANFPGRVDHALLKGQYTVFVNPSITEVLCTTTAEALAMGKFAVIPDHPSNRFFKRFPNALFYRNKWEFAANLNWALTHDPEPLTHDLSRQFSWEAATERFMAAAAITRREARERELLGRSKLDERIAWFHNELGKGAKGDVLRAMCGGGPISHQVRYETEKKEAELLMLGLTEESSAESLNKIEEVEEDEGLPLKLRRSTFAEAIRSTLSSLVPLYAGGNLVVQEGMG